MSRRCVAVPLILAFLFVQVPVATAQPASSGGVAEFPVCTAAWGQYSPAISGSKVAWQSWYEGHYRVHVRDLASGEESVVGGPSQLGQGPDVWGDTVVFDGYGGDSKLYAYDLGSLTSTSHACEPLGGPEVCQNKVVWTDRRGGRSNTDIYLWDLSTNQERQVTTNTAFQSFPDIYEDTVVYADWRNGGWRNTDIYMYDLTTSQERPLTLNPTNQTLPTIWRDKVVWQDKRRGNWDIYLYDLSTRRGRLLTTNRAAQLNPAIWEDKVVWADGRNGAYDIYCYDLSRNRTVLVCGARGNQRVPAVYEDTVVWQDERATRGHSPDIYGAHLWFPAWLTRPYTRRFHALSEDYPLRGYLKLQHPAGLCSVWVQCQHYYRGRWAYWHTVETTNLDYHDFTRYATVFRLPRRGYWRLRAYHTCTRHAPTYSAWTRVTVR